MSDTVYTISQLKERLIPIFINNRIKRAILFGSYGKGKATKESDIDLEIQKTGVLMYEKWSNLPIGNDRNTVILPTYEEIDHKDIMRFYVREFVEDKGIRRQLFDILKRRDYMDMYLNKFHELTLYEDFVDFIF